MARIEIKDLSGEKKRKKLTAEELKKITGGAAPWWTTQGVTKTLYTAHNKPEYAY